MPELTEPETPGRTLVIDAHGHGTHLLPRPVQAVRRPTVRSHPADAPLSELARPLLVQDAFAGRPAIRFDGKSTQAANVGLQ